MNPENNFDRRQEDQHIGELIATVQGFQSELSNLRIMVGQSETEIMNRIIAIEQSVHTANVLMAEIKGAEKGKTAVYTWITGIVGFLIGYFKDQILLILSGKYGH